jgi:hypothetical protein
MEGTMNDTQTMYDAARLYAERGWHVFPVRDKRPLIAWRDGSSSEPSAIDAMPWDDATGIGVDCGKSGLVVVDIDDVNSIPVLADALGWDPTDDNTVIAKTGRGGYHIYYQAGSSSVRNSASKVVPGIDIRGDGGYVVLPPSKHESGRRYEWTTGLSTLRPIPEKMVELFNYREEPAPTPPPPPVSHEKWGLAALAAQAHEVENSQPGRRNDQLNNSAFQIFGIVKGGHLDEALARLRMERAGLHVGLSAEEVKRTLDSAWQAAEPRHPHDSPTPVALHRSVTETRRTYRALSVQELESLPPPQWLLPGILPEGQTWLYGEPGSGKTFLALDWAATVAASGLNVVYFVGEGVTGFARRVAAWRRAHGRDLTTFYAVPQAPHLLDREAVATLKQTVNELSPALVVIDTFARASVGGDENSAKDVGLAIDALDMLWREHQASSLVIHHSNKYGGSERGSSAIRGAADATWEVQPGINGDKTIGGQAFCRKMKDAEPPPPMLFRINGMLDSAIVYPSALL